MPEQEKHSQEEKQPRKRGQRKPRRRGTGSVFRRPEREGGKDWVAQIILEDGKPMQRYFKTQKEAVEKMKGLFDRPS